MNTIHGFLAFYGLVCCTTILLYATDEMQVDGWAASCEPCGPTHSDLALMIFTSHLAHTTVVNGGFMVHGCRGSHVWYNVCLRLVKLMPFGTTSLSVDARSIDCMYIVVYGRIVTVEFTNTN